ncbi:MAG TPA: glycosyltransferase, partial [Verrucomicrobiae bacterium]|nr:glycosyltransferase [Verrucomicrobiae bacterium]
MPVDISIIVPVFNEEDNLLPLAREVAKALDKEPRAFELVFVDDGSGDGTWEKIQEAHRLDRRVRGLRHAR